VKGKFTDQGRRWEAGSLTVWLYRVFYVYRRPIAVFASTNNRIVSWGRWIYSHSHIPCVSDPL